MNAALEMAIWSLSPMSEGGDVGIIIHGRNVGATGDLTVTPGQVSALDVQIQRLGRDVEAQSTDVAVLLSTTDFLARWDSWHAENSLGSFPIPFVILQGKAAEFDAFQLEYDDRLAAATQIGVVTQAKPSGSLGPDWLSFAKWGLVLGAVAYVAAQSGILPALVARTR